QLRAALTRTEARADEDERRIVRLQINNGATALEEDDTTTAIVFFIDALRANRGGSERNHRTRIATALRQSPRMLRNQALDQFGTPQAPLNAALSPDVRFLAVVQADSVRVWDLGTGSSHELFIGRSEQVRLAFGSSGRLFCTQVLDGIARLWDLFGPEPV